MSCGACVCVSRACAGCDAAVQLYMARSLYVSIRKSEVSDLYTALAEV